MSNPYYKEWKETGTGEPNEQIVSIIIYLEF